MAEKNYLKPKGGKVASNFGRVVAEQDQDLLTYYVEPERYVNRALDFNDPAVFFVGPKGAGKSAILQMVRLTKEADADRIITISPDDLAFSALLNIQATTPILTESSKHQWLFKSLWDYILSLEVLRRHFKDKATFRLYLSELLGKLFGNQRDAEARRLLLVSLGDDGNCQSLSSRILQLVNEVEISAEVSDTTKLSGKAKFDAAKADQGKQLWLLSLINNVAKKINETITAPYYILIDDLDLHWHDTPLQNAFIAALFFSLRNFSRPPYLKCAVAIRDQIFRRLPLVDRDKYHDWVCPVEWQEPNVKRMVERRITATLDVPSHQIWGGLFPTNAFTRMTRHTFGRPREAIRLISMCVDEAVRRSHLRVHEEDLERGITKFSELRIPEIANEFGHRYGGLDHIIRKFKKKDKEFQVSFLKEVAEDIWLENECGEEMAKEYQWASGFTENLQGLATVLLECGILLYKDNREANPAKYDLDAKPPIKLETWVAMHPAFWPALEMA